LSTNSTREPACGFGLRGAFSRFLRKITGVLDFRTDTSYEKPPCFLLSGYTTSYSYDGVGRQVESIDPLGNISSAKHQDILDKVFEFSN
jgi:hypothetical protein